MSTMTDTITSPTRSMASRQPDVRAAAEAAMTAPLPVAEVDAQWEDLEERLKAVQQQGDELNCRVGVSEDEWRSWAEADNAITQEIEALPAHTLVGLRVKALAVINSRGGFVDLSGSAEPKTADVRIAEEIVRTLAAM